MHVAAAAAVVVAAEEAEDAVQKTHQKPLGDAATAAVVVVVEAVLVQLTGTRSRVLSVARCPVLVALIALEPTRPS